MTQKENQKLSVGIIMDGNRRWAKERGLPTLSGHKKGYEKIKEIVRWSENLPISTLTFFAFSKENWNREKKEVNYLMDLFRLALKKDLAELIGKCVIKFIGDREDLADDLKRLILDLEARSKEKGGKILVVIALSYGGRDEIIRAIKKIENPREINEEKFESLLDTADIPDPDLIIRTSGEKRLSGFLPWQGVYSELFFVDTYWPDFKEKEFSDIVSGYYSRKRRFGK